MHDQTSTLKPAWWLFPPAFLLAVLIPLALGISIFGPDIISTNSHNYTAPNFQNFAFSAFYIGSLVILAAASGFGAFTMAPQQQVVFKPQALDFLFWLSTAGYLIWFGALFIFDFSTVIAALTGKADATSTIRQNATTIPGVTTTTQFALIYISIYFLSPPDIQKQFSDPKYRRYLYVLLTFGLIRSIIFSERVAIIELLFIIVVAYAKHPTAIWAPAQLLVRQFPLFTFAGAPVLFAAFEYNRSWVAHYSQYFDSIIDFSLERLGIYYASALNNICGFLLISDWPNYSGDWTFYWLYKLPIIGPELAKLVGNQSADYGLFLVQNNLFEFNNYTGNMSVLADWGFVGGAIFFAIYGIVLGRQYVSFIAQSGHGLYLFPPMMYSVFEILRIGYIYDPRFFAALIGYTFVASKWAIKR